ncbi:unnamed protein product [Debaryomyces tyrocola]|nr:unnamed protein product [Debaryomyces tyrocola]
MSLSKSEESDTQKPKTKKEKEEANLKLIKTTSGIRVSQACDRCRIKKIKCDGLTPCLNCSKIGFDCKTSDKLTRRAFPKGYTENLEKKLRELEEQNRLLRLKYGEAEEDDDTSEKHKETNAGTFMHRQVETNSTKARNENEGTSMKNQNNPIQINNPIDQIFNLDDKGIIIGNDNLNFESQFNHLLINLNLPFLKITNSHNFLLNDPNSYLYHPSYAMHNQFQNRDLDVPYNPLTANDSQHDGIPGEMSNLTNSQLPMDIYDLFIKLINNFKKIISSKKELDNQILHFFLNYNVFIPIFDIKQFMKSYDEFHTMYPFMFTYDDATINGFNILNNDYHVVSEYLMIVVQIYAMLMMNDPTINLNLLLNHIEPSFSNSNNLKEDRKSNVSMIRSLYDFLPYFNVFHVSIPQLQTYLLFLYYSLLTNNKEKSLVLSSLVNSFIGILGINLNSKNLFFNDLTLNLQQKRNRVKMFWVFKVLLKCFNLKFGFKPSLNTTVINPVTIERYFELTPEKLSLLLETKEEGIDDLFEVLLKPSTEFLNLVNIIIPSSFSPNYYQYLKNGSNQNHHQSLKKNPKHLDWILNDDDGDGNDGNLNYNFTQFLTIDKNLSNWRYSLKDKRIDLTPLHQYLKLPIISDVTTNNLYQKLSVSNIKSSSGITQEGIMNYLNTGLPDIYTASQLIKIQLNFHYLLIRSMNYLNFVIDKELTNTYYMKIANISSEVLAYFILVFEHIGQSMETWENSAGEVKTKSGNNIIMDGLGLDVDDDGFVINDFSVKRRRTSSQFPFDQRDRKVKQVPPSLFNYMLNGLSMTIINLKKSIILQMLYLLICQLKIAKKKGVIEPEIISLLNKSIQLFVKIFINYETNNRHKPVKKNKEDELFLKLINDELKEEILTEPRNNDESDDEDMDEDAANHNGLDIDWDDEDMDEDLKYLKILKFIKYKVQVLASNNNQPNVEVPNTENTVHRQSLPSLMETIDSSGSKNNTVSGSEASTIENAARPKSINKLSSGNNFYTSASSTNSNSSYNTPGMQKIPSMSKFDFLLGEDTFPIHTATSPPYTINSHNPSMTGLKDAHQLSDLVKKERLAVNDLMNMKHAHKNTKQSTSPSWQYNPNSASPTNQHVASSGTVDNNNN